MSASLLDCFIAASITALATGLGAVPFFFVKRTDGTTIHACSASAAGMMLGASAVLLWEGLACDASAFKWGVSSGAALGWAFLSRLKGSFPESMSVLEDSIWRNLARIFFIHNRVLDLQGADAKHALLILGAMFLHSFAEGMGIGVSFAGGDRLGHAVSASLAVHNVPEGFAVSVMLVDRGVDVWRSLFVSILTSIPQPIIAIPAYLFVQQFRRVLPIGLGFAAGAMALITFSELLPEARHGLKNDQVLVGIVAVSAVAMLLFHWSELL